MTSDEKSISAHGSQRPERNTDWRLRCKCRIPGWKSVRRIGVNDEFVHSGPAAALLKPFGLSAENIVKTALEFAKNRYRRYMEWKS